jgi:superfamily II DNA or RNA helicase
MAALSYNPVVADADELLRSTAPASVLVIGQEVPEAVVAAGEARYLDGEVPIQLPRGLYRFDLGTSQAVMVVDEGSKPGPPTAADWSDSDDDPLINAYDWFVAWWDEAVTVPLPRFSTGDSVVTVPGGQEAVVRARAFDDGSWWYGVRVDARTISVRESALAAPDHDDDPSRWIRREPADAKRFAATLTRAKLREHLTDTVYSFRATRTIFRPYQFRPVMRLLMTGSLRLLIADEVGLGKTIEAGLVWTELDARQLANRVLVVCPSMLVSKWQAEMEERFGFVLTELDRDGLDDFLERADTDRLPARFSAVCSIERLRMWDGLERLAELSPQLDLVIVDEAHVFRNSETRSHALGALLSDWADAMIFLSATPLNLGNDDLYNLLALLAPGEFDDRRVLEQRLEPNAVLHQVAASLLDQTVTNETRLKWLLRVFELAFAGAVVNRSEFRELLDVLSQPELTPVSVVEARRLISRLHALSAVVTRTRKVEIQEHKAVREARPIPVQWTSEEAELYAEFEKWQRDRALRRGLPVGFVTQMPLRLASTCLPAARDRLLSWEEGVLDLEDLDSEVEDPDLDDAPPPELIELARNLGDVDSKFDAFEPVLRSIVTDGRQVLVFTWSRTALAYLERRLRDDFSLAVLHGGVDRAQRRDVISRFRNGDYDVVLASRVASEGLDFEFCSAIVNYDLPWNPMEVEQRIGRIDRMGQTEEKVLIFNFHTPGTIETDIIERVHHRIGVFTDSIGELEPIIQSQMTELRRAMFDFTLSDAQRARRIDEALAAIEEQRRTLDEVENASAYLSSTDSAEIDGLERDLLAQGRYVGQSELVLLLEDWCNAAGAGPCTRSSDGSHVIVRGNQAMAIQLRGLQSAGERSGAEVDALERLLRDEMDLHLCLDQEVARTTGGDLLSATHPLTRAALRVPGHAEARFAYVRIPAADVPAGAYLVVLAIARWDGLRPSSEIWSVAIDLEHGETTSAVGDALLAALAEGTIGEGHEDSLRSEVDLDDALRRAKRVLRRRHTTEQQERLDENASLVEARRISLRETHQRKVEQIRRRIDTARRNGRSKAIRLNEAQLQAQDRRLREAETKIDEARVGSMSVEYLACAVVTVEEQSNG